jgi:hypothetical protein
VVVPINHTVALSPSIHIGCSTTSASRVTRIAVSFDACFDWVNSATIGIFGPVEMIVQPKL